MGFLDKVFEDSDPELKARWDEMIKKFIASKEAFREGLESHVGDSARYTEYGSVEGMGAEHIASSEPIRGQTADFMVIDELADSPHTFIKSVASFKLECKRKAHKQKTLNKYYSLMDEPNSEEQIVVKPDGDTLTILRGVAPEPNNPEPVRISGHIDTPQRFYEKRKEETFNKDDAHLEVNTQRKKITLYVDPSDDLAPVVSGSIRRYKPLLAFKINDGEFGKDDFKLMLKKHRFLFKKSSECGELVNRLENLDMTIERQLKDKDDKRGNRSLVAKQTVESEIPETITLQSQIFVEGDEHEITADICYDVDSSGRIKFWLESSSLYEMVEEKSREMISETVAEFNDEIVIIYK